MSEARPTMNGKPVFTVPSKAVFNFDSGFKHKKLCDVRGDSFTRTVKALSDAGFHDDQQRLSKVINDKEAWEEYARLTFQAHAEMRYRPGQLRFMQYVNKQTRDWWKNREELGAVLL